MADERDAWSSDRTLPLTPSSADALIQPAQAPRLAADEVVAGRYRIIGIAGEGGMGVVYRAADLELGGEIALKTLNTPAHGGERAMSRFRREVQLARRVTHPNVCRIFDFGYHDTADSKRFAFVTMELLEGKTLSQLLGKRGRFTAAEAGVIVTQLCAGLNAAHDAGVIHRDFKSANVVVVRREQSGTIRAVITDFGLARLNESDSGEASLSQDGAIVGTPAYMSPEQVSGGEIGPAADIYALGIVMYELLTNELPFTGGSNITSLVRRLSEQPPSPRVHVPDLDARWEAVIMRCLEREPRERFASANEVARALAGETPVTVPSKLRKRQIVSAALIAAVLLATVGLAIWKYAATTPAPFPHASSVAPRRAVAVLGFRNLSGQAETAWLSTALAEMLTTELASSETLRMIPGEEVARAKSDLALGDVETHAPATLGRLRKAIGADVVILGAYTAIGKQDQRHLRVDVRVQRTSEGETIASFHDTGTEAGLFDLVARTGAELRRRLGLAEIDSRGRLAPRASAARLFADGLTALRRHEALAARELLEEAIAADPKFPLAYTALADVYTILGYDRQSVDAARKAHELSGKLPRGEKLLIEAKYRQRAREHDRAIEIYRQLIAFYPDDPEYRVHLINTLTETARGKEALEAIEAMRKAGAAGDSRIDLLEAWTQEIFADYQKGLAAAGRAIATSRANGNRNVLADALVMRGWALGYTGHEEEALAAFSEAEDLFSTMGNRAGVAKSLRKRAFVYWRRGEYDETTRLLERARRIYEETGQPQGVASSIGGIGVIRNQQGQHAEARKLFEEALGLYRKIGDRQNIAWALGSIAGTYVMEGNRARGIAMYEQLLAQAKELGDTSMQAFTLGNLGITHMHSGDLAMAERRSNEALKIFDASGDRSSAREVEDALAEIAVYRGDLAKARAILEKSLHERREAAEDGGIALSQFGLALVSLHGGKPADAVALASAASSKFEEQERFEVRVNALDVVLRAHLALRQQERAESALATMRTVVEKAQNPEAGFVTMLAAVHVAAARPDAPIDELRGELAKVIAFAKEHHSYPIRFDAELLLAQLEARAGRARASRELLTRTRDEAARRDFGLYARAAEALLSASRQPVE
jgi:tetratricopeptide (TPR) repeat protein/TolB-like protein